MLKISQEKQQVSYTTLILHKDYCTNNELYKKIIQKTAV